MLFKHQIRFCLIGFTFLVLLTSACKKQSPIFRPIESLQIDSVAPIVKITFPKSDSTYHKRDTLNIHVEVDDNMKTDYPSIFISRLNGSNNIIEASYGAAFPDKHFSADMGWIVVTPLTQEDTIMIMATSTDYSGNLGKDSVIFYISR